MTSFKPTKVGSFHSQEKERKMAHTNRTILTVVSLKTTQDNFCGTKSFEKVAINRGYLCQTLDLEPEHQPDIIGNILFTDPGSCWFAHFSPPCTGFSVASIGTHWGGGYRKYEPKTETAKLGIKILNRVAELIAKHKYQYWTVENPMGVFRKVFPEILKKHGIKDFKMVTVTYCQYGDSRMKPTDIFTNIPNWQGKRCKNGSPCHEPAPRGSKTGTQGLKNAKLRGVIPPKLFHEIFDCIEKLEDNKNAQTKG